MGMVDLFGVMIVNLIIVFQIYSFNKYERDSRLLKKSETLKFSQIKTYGQI